MQPSDGDPCALWETSPLGSAFRLILGRTWKWHFIKHKVFLLLWSKVVASFSRLCGASIIGNHFLISLMSISCEAGVEVSVKVN